MVGDGWFDKTGIDRLMCWRGVARGKELVLVKVTCHPCGI